MTLPSSESCNKPRPTIVQLHFCSPIILIAFGIRERAGREEARDDHGEDADEGHDDRIEKLKDREQLLSNKIGHLDGEYEYTEPMQDADENARREAEEENEKRWQQRADATQDEDHEENSDMDLESGDN